MLSETSHRRANTVWFHLCEVSRRVRFIETEGRTLVTWGWGRGDGELVFNGYKVSVRGDEDVLQIVM